MHLPLCWALVAVVFVHAQGLSGSLQINNPVAVVQCEPVVISWTGNMPPYLLSVLPGGDANAGVLENLPATSSNSITWTPDLRSGTSITFKLKDATGELAFSATEIIQPGGNNNCLPNGINNFDVTTFTAVTALTATGSIITTTSTIVIPTSDLPTFTQTSTSPVPPPTSTSTPSPSTDSHIAIIAGVAGGALCLIFIIGFFYWLRRRDRSRVDLLGAEEQVDGLGRPVLRQRMNGPSPTRMRDASIPTGAPAGPAFISVPPGMAPTTTPFQLPAWHPSAQGVAVQGGLNQAWAPGTTYERRIARPAGVSPHHRTTSEPHTQSWADPRRDAYPDAYQRPLSFGETPIGTSDFVGRYVDANRGPPSFGATPAGSSDVLSTYVDANRRPLSFGEIAAGSSDVAGTYVDANRRPLSFGETSAGISEVTSSYVASLGGRPAGVPNPRSSPPATSSPQQIDRSVAHVADVNVQDAGTAPHPTPSAHGVAGISHSSDVRSEASGSAMAPLSDLEEAPPAYEK